MFRETRPEQISMFDRVYTADDQVRKALEHSRAKLVGDYIYPSVDESKFAPLFSNDGCSRPNTGIRLYFCAEVLMRTYGLTAQHFIEFLRGGFVPFQYALHTTSAEKQPLSERSLTRFHAAVRKYNEEHKCDLIKEEYKRISQKMGVRMGVIPDEEEDNPEHEFVVRMDSMQVESHGKVMPRLEILYTTNFILIRWLINHDFSDAVPKSMHHYINDDDKTRTLYYRVGNDTKAAEQETRVAKAIDEMVQLKHSMQINFAPVRLAAIEEYQLLCRVLDEQTETDVDGAIRPKDKKDISTNSVQNPFEPDATYRYKNGSHHGSVLNVAEAIDGKGNGIIVNAEFEPNTTSDSRMAEDFIAEQTDDGPKMRMPADGAYASEASQQAVKEKNIEIKTTSLTGKVPDKIFADWEFNENETGFTRCPAGYPPVSCTYSPKQGCITAHMPDSCCAKCPNRDRCKARVSGKGKKQHSSVRVRIASVHRAQMIKNQKANSEETLKNAHQRNGVEGVMSVMRRKYRLDHIPVFGRQAASLWVWTSLLSYNLVKYDKWVKETFKNALSKGGSLPSFT